MSRSFWPCNLQLLQLPLPQLLPHLHQQQQRHQQHHQQQKHLQHQQQQRHLLLLLLLLLRSLPQLPPRKKTRS